MRKLFYLPLEPYKERYTESLTTWTVDRLKPLALEMHVVMGNNEKYQGRPIKTGSVLDAHGRSYWSLTQMANLVETLRNTPTCIDDVIYFDDMFTPGFEALPYILEQMPPTECPKVFVRNHAQSVDPDDFTFKMRYWMRPFEEMVSMFSHGVICASSCHEELMRVAMQRTPVHVLGLPYDENAVLATHDAPIIPIESRERQVIYSSRFQKEKQPRFFMDVVEAVKAQRPDIQFVMCTGSNRVRSDDVEALVRLRFMEDDNLITVLKDCSKQDYYRELARSRVQLNTAKQDFVSYTAIEASTFGTMTIAPAFRSFPETMRNNRRNLYVPWSLEDAVAQVIAGVDNPVNDGGWLSRAHHSTLDRIGRLFEGRRYEKWWEL